MHDRRSDISARRGAERRLHVSAPQPPGRAPAKNTYTYSRYRLRRCYFPGSHRNVAKYFQSHPQEFIDGTFQNSWGMSGDDQSFANDLSSLGAVRPPVESVMRAGSVCFAHGWIVHR